MIHSWVSGCWWGSSSQSRLCRLSPLPFSPILTQTWPGLPLPDSIAHEVCSFITFSLGIQVPSAVMHWSLRGENRKRSYLKLLHCKERIPDHNNNASRGLGQIGRWKGKTNSGLRASGVFDLPVSLIMQAIVVLGARGRVPNPVEWMPAPWFLSHNYNPRFSFLRSHSPSLYSLSSLALWDWVPPARIAFKNGKNLSFWKP